MAKVPPIPHSAKLTNDKGLLTAVWADFFKQAFARMGGHGAQSNTELAETITERLPVGAAISYAGSTAPTGFVFADGSEISRTTYAALFAVCGTTYGAGDGSTTFNVPNLAERVVVGKHSSGTFATLGATGGAETAALPNHVHPVNITTDTPSSTADIQDTGAGLIVATSTHTHLVSGNTGNPSTNPTSSTLQPYIVLNKIIRT